MNYLAHMYLSCGDEDLIVGNMLVDMLPLKRLKALPEQYAQGFELHRLIDSYTDSHAKVKEAVVQLRKQQGKYAPVVIDIFYDYILSQEWSRYEGQEIQSFCNDIYEVLPKHYEQLPEDIVKRFQAMIDNNYLMTCSTAPLLQSVFDRVGGRARFMNGFAHATEDLINDYEFYKENFHSFFPDIIAEVGAFCSCD